MAKFPPLMALPPIAFLGLASLFIFGMNRDDPDQLPSAVAGQMAPSLSTVTQLGTLDVISDSFLSAGEGTVTLVNYWASWCAPCRAEHAQLETLAGEGVPILGVNYKDKSEAALGFLRELGNPYAAAGSDEAGRTALEWGLYGVPETFVVNGEGRVTYRFAGPITQEILDLYIRPEIDAARE